MVDGFAAQRFVHALIFGHSERCGHPIGGVKSRERRSLVDSRIFAVDETFPTDLLQEGEFQVRPGLDVLGDVLLVVFRMVFGVLFAIRTDDADHAVVEVDVVVLVNRTHVVRAVNVGVILDQINIGFVAKDDLIEQLDGEFSKLDCVASESFNFLPLLLADSPANPSGEAPVGVDRSAADHLDQVMAVSAHFKHLAGNVHADLIDDPQDVPLGYWRIGSHHEIRTAKCVEVRGVVRGVEKAVEHFT